MSATYMFVLFLWAVVFTTPSIVNGDAGEEVIISIHKKDINSVDPLSFEAQLNKKPGKPPSSPLPDVVSDSAAPATIAVQLQKSYVSSRKGKSKPAKKPKSPSKGKKKAGPTPSPPDDSAKDGGPGGDDPEA